MEEYANELVKQGVKNPRKVPKVIYVVSAMLLKNKYRCPRNKGES